jgi:hypothetical protein
MAIQDKPRDLPAAKPGWVPPEVENFETPMEVTFYSGRA